jgi:hypothetical protein
MAKMMTMMTAMTMTVSCCCHPDFLPYFSNADQFFPTADDHEVVDDDNQENPRNRAAATVKIKVSQIYFSN